MADASKVVVGVTGKVWVGATSATGPTASDSVLTGFTDLGFVSADGLSITPEKSTTNINAWQDSALVRTVVTESSLTYSFTLLETSEDAVELYFGSTITDGKVLVNPANTGGRKSFVFDVVDGDKVIRHYIPSGEIISVEAQTVASGDAMGYGITVTAYQTSGRSADVFYSEFEV
jgi:hypothetical protein